MPTRNVSIQAIDRPEGETWNSAGRTKNLGGDLTGCGSKSSLGIARWIGPARRSNPAVDLTNQMTRLLPSVRRDRARTKLKRLLAIADDAAFCRMIWAVARLQDGDPERAARYLSYPKEAVGGDIASTYRVHP